MLVMSPAWGAVAVLAVIVGACSSGTGQEQAAPFGDAGEGGTAAEASTDAGQVVPCTSASDCLSGQVCCEISINSVINSVTRACEAECPVGTRGPIQLCEASADCFAKGDTCGPLAADPSLGVMVCNPPSDDGGAEGSDEAGVDGGGVPDGSADSGTSDAPAGG